MCILTMLPAGVLPNAVHLYAGAEANPDGHGYAIVAGERIIIGKGMDADKMITEFEAVRKLYPDGPALFHSRIATAGVVNEYNVHPFYVGGDTRTVIAHNGIMPRAVQPGKSNPASDTRITAEKFLPQFGSLRYRGNRKRFERWMTTANKVVLLTVDKRYKENAYILNEDQGVWDEGIWYSNTTYLPWVMPRRYLTAKDWREYANSFTGSTYTTATGGGATNPMYLDRCGSCNGTVDYAKYSECQWCGWCLDCGEETGFCLCYAPGKPDTPVSPAPATVIGPAKEVDYSKPLWALD